LQNLQEDVSQDERREEYKLRQLLQAQQGLFDRPYLTRKEQGPQGG